jgi:transposase
MLPTSVRIFVCTQPLDMRRSFDGEADDRRGSAARRAVRVRKPAIEPLCKRLHQALFWLPSATAPSDRSVSVDGRGLHELLRGVAAPPLSRVHRRV